MMNTSIPQLSAFLLNIHQVPAVILEEYIHHWQAHTIAGKKIMTAEGDTQRFMYFVMKGIQKSYYLKDGKQHVIAFTYPPSFTGIPESFFTQKPSRYFLETITDSQFLRIPFERHQELMRQYCEIETLFRKATEMFLVGVMDRQYELMALDMETRFRAFVKRSPHLLQMVAQKDLASYLRMDATNFSKLMNTVKI